MVVEFRATHRFGELLRSTERFCELPFALRLGRASVTGRMDVLYRCADGMWTVLDYKTGRIEEEAYGAREYRVQLQAYALAVEALFGARRVEAVLALLRGGCREHREVFDRERLREAEGELAGKVEAMLSLEPERLEPPRDERCAACPYRPICRPEWLKGLDARRRSVPAGDLELRIAGQAR